MTSAVGGVDATLDEIQGALDILKRAKGYMVKQPLVKADHPLRAMDYHAVAQAEKNAGGSNLVLSGHGQTKELVVAHLERILKDQARFPEASEQIQGKPSQIQKAWQAKLERDFPGGVIIDSSDAPVGDLDLTVDPPIIVGMVGDFDPVLKLSTVSLKVYEGRLLGWTVVQKDPLTVMVVLENTSPMLWSPRTVADN